MSTRRDFLSRAMAAAAAPALFPAFGRAQAATGAGVAGFHDGGSAASTGKPKELKVAEIAGFLSKEQLAVHHAAHYGGAVKSLAEIATQLNAADRTKANANWSERRELGREETHALNSIVLHELYFGGLSAKTVKRGERVTSTLELRFGEFDKWLDDFKAAAISARGWAMLVYQPVNGKLYNVVSDVHDVGPMVLGHPLVVLDCYEHAYYVDYKNKKADYVNAFAPFVDWDEVERRIASLP